MRPCGAVLSLIDACECVQILGIFIERGLDLCGKTRRDGQRLGVLIVVRIGEKEAAPSLKQCGLDLQKLLIDGGCGGVLLLPGVDAGKAVEGIGAARIHCERGTEFGGGKIELVFVESLRTLAQGEPEAGSSQRGLNGRDLVAVLLGLD